MKSLFPLFANEEAAAYEQQKEVARDSTLNSLKNVNSAENSAKLALPQGSDWIGILTSPATHL